MSNNPARVDFLTVISVSMIAYAAAGLVHEILGHGTAALLLGFPIMRISTVAVETLSDGFLVPASGSIANLAAGAISLFLFHRARGFTATRYFLWLFATINILDAVGHLLFSGLANFGDWSAVIADFTPHWPWRVALVLTGGGFYVWAVRIGAETMAGLVSGSLVGRDDLNRLVMPAYIAGGVIMVAASLLNPFSPKLILLSGAVSTFGNTCGLINIPAMAARQAASDQPAPEVTLPPSKAWIIAAVPVAAIVVGILGPGIMFVRG